MNKQRASPNSHFTGDFGRFFMISAFYANWSNQQDGMKQPAAEGRSFFAWNAGSSNQ